MTSGEKVERLVVAAVGGLELVPEAELPLVLQLQADNRLAQGASVLADDTQGSTFEKLKFLEKISTYKRVTEVQEESPEAHPFTVGVAGVGSGADVAHGHLQPSSTEHASVSKASKTSASSADDPCLPF